MTRIPGLKTLRRHARQFAARCRPSALVLGYHRVTEDGVDPYGMAVSRARFEGQMRELARRGIASDLAGLVETLAHGMPARGGVAVTFDDGYIDNLEVARPILERFELPFTVFVTTGRLGGRFWWHRLADAALSLAESGRTLSFDGQSRRWRVGPAGRATVAPGGALAAAYRALAILDVRERERLVDELVAAQGERTAIERAMTESELQDLASSARASIGAHGVTHTPLTDLDEESAGHELRECRETLERVTGRAIRHLSYPHGRVSDSVRSIARACGYEAACASEPSPVFRGHDPFCLPRVWVPDIDAPGFDRWLTRWTGD